MEEVIKLSVIVPTRNRCDLLNKTLESILSQTIDKKFFEVIVVDNGSTDNTEQVCKEFENKFNLTYIYEPKPGLHEGRHTGLRYAKSEILVYADDDIEAFPEWLETINYIFSQNNKVGLVGGKNLPKFETTPPFWILEKWNIIYKNMGYIMGELSLLDFGNIEREILPHYVFGCNFSVRKSIIIDAGGFHPDGMPFELIRFRGDGETYISEYIAKSDYIAYYHPKASVYHYVSEDRMTEEYFCKRKYCQGISDAYTFLRKTKNKKKVEISNITLKKYNIFFSGISGMKILNYLKKEVIKTDFQKKLERSYNNGYDYLFAAYELHEDVREWVHKYKYL